jgi:hypothetical protein
MFLPTYFLYLFYYLCVIILLVWVAYLLVLTTIVLCGSISVMKQPIYITYQNKPAHVINFKLRLKYFLIAFIYKWADLQAKYQ